MLSFLVAHCFSALLELVLLSRSSDRNKDFQILLLRRHLAIIQRQLDAPVRTNRTDKLTLALLTIKLKRITRLSISQLQSVIHIVQPPAVLKWHGQLVLFVARRHLMTHYKDQILAYDFFTVKTLFLNTIYVQFFIAVEMPGSLCRLHLASNT